MENLILPTDLLRYAYKVLTERKFRAVLTIIGISIGPMALVSIISVMQGYSETILQQLTTFGQNTVVLFPEKGYVFTEKDLRLIKSLPEVAKASPFYYVRGSIRQPRGSMEVFIYATDIEVLFEVVSNLEVKEGKIPPPTARTDTLVGYYIAYEKHTNRKIRNVGDVITVEVAEIMQQGIRTRRVSLRISGILSRYGGALIVDPDRTIFLPLAAGPTILKQDRWSGIFIVAKDSSVVDSLVNKLEDMYKDYANVVAFIRIARTVNSITSALDFLLFSTSLAAFAVAIAGVAATMITSVMERTREIGVLKALGFTNTDVLLMILTEGFIMSLIGGSVGIIVGALGAQVLASAGLTLGGLGVTLKASPKLTPWLITEALGLTVLVGIVGGLFPAYRASKIPPAVALRYE